jgi:hypothetical protein
MFPEVYVDLASEIISLSGFLDEYLPDLLRSNLLETRPVKLVL